MPAAFCALLLASAVAADAKPARHASAGRHAVARHRALAHPPLDSRLIGRNADALRLAARIAEAQRLDPEWTRAVIARARYLPEVLALSAPPVQAATKNWAAYRERFIEPARVAAGVAFWNVNERWLEAAHQRYGVDPFVIVGIVGVETFYGRITGRFRVLDALTTLALARPAGGNDRRAFFGDELGSWLALAAREHIDPAATLGSYAGAIGLGQFMPGSIERWAVDFDADGRIDMAADPADVIGSIANYLAGHGWQSATPTHFDVVPPPADSDARARLLAPDITPSFSAEQFAAAGADLSEAGRRHDGLLALVELRNGKMAAPSHVAGTTNFYAVTRYNRSAYYAMAVIELGLAVQAQRAIGQAATTAVTRTAP